MLLEKKSYEVTGDQYHGVEFDLLDQWQIVVMTIVISYLMNHVIGWNQPVEDEGFLVAWGQELVIAISLHNCSEAPDR